MIFFQGKHTKNRKATDDKSDFGKMIGKSIIWAFFQNKIFPQLQQRPNQIYNVLWLS